MEQIIEGDLMLTQEFLEKIGFEKEDASKIIELNLKYHKRTEPLVKEYVSVMTGGFMKPYSQSERAETDERTDRFIKAVQSELSELDEYTSRLLGWVNCIPYLKDRYDKYGVSEEIFFESMKDFSYKLKECKTIHNSIGLFVDWFFLFFDMKIFSLGRLQFHVNSFLCDEYKKCGIELKKGDTVYFCHIPSSGKLTRELCMDSFQRAYEFFKQQLKGDIIPIVSNTWLLYQPYIEKVYSDGSNLKNFAEMFDVIDVKSSGNDFPDGWRIFGKLYNGNVDEMPADNTLRKNFINYIKNGGDFGTGYGVILYDGVTRKIVT